MDALLGLGANAPADGLRANGGGALESLIGREEWSAPRVLDRETACIDTLVERNCGR